MSKARKFFQMGILSGGGFVTPYTFDATTAADGALPAYFAGATFSVSSGKIINTPTVGSNLLTDPGLEAAYTAGKCNTLTATGSPTVAESADVHGGSKAQEFTAVAFNNQLNYPTVTGIAGAWYRFSAWAKRTAGTGTDTRTKHFQTGSLPAASMFTPITSATYAKKTLGFISTTTNSIFCYPANEQGSSAFDTVIVDDGTLERLTYSTLFSMITTPVSRLATVKIQPDTFADATITAVVHWADASASPTTYLLAWSAFYNTETTIQVGLIKCVAGTYTALIAPTAITPVADAWLEIRAVDNDTVGLYYNNIQRGTNQDVTDVTGSYCGQVITGGNNLKSFFVG